MENLQARAKSGDYARVLFEAWRHGDRDTLRQQLEDLAVLKPAAGLPLVEYERWDLLAAIVQNMRQAIGRNPELSAECDFEISVQLLEHLMSSTPVRIGKRIVDILQLS